MDRDKVRDRPRNTIMEEQLNVKGNGQDLEEECAELVAVRYFWYA